MFNSVLALITMAFLHCIADFSLQGILASMKQKNWWRKEFVKLGKGPLDKSKYSNDYKMALGIHSFEWSFVVMLPCMYKLYLLGNDFSWKVFGIMLMYTFFIVSNTAFHYAIDDSKANDGELNLIQDQWFHAAQIIVTWLLWTISVGW